MTCFPEQHLDGSTEDLHVGAKSSLCLYQFYLIYLYLFCLIAWDTLSGKIGNLMKYTGTETYRQSRSCVPTKCSSNLLAERKLPIFIFLIVTLTLYVHGYFQDVCKCQGQCSKKLFYLAILTELRQSLFIYLNYAFLMAERVGWLSLPSLCNGKLSQKRSRMEQEVSCIQLHNRADLRLFSKQRNNRAHRVLLPIAKHCYSCRFYLFIY